MTAMGLLQLGAAAFAGAFVVALAVLVVAQAATARREARARWERP